MAVRDKGGRLNASAGLANDSRTLELSRTLWSVCLERFSCLAQGNPRSL